MTTLRQKKFLVVLAVIAILLGVAVETGAQSKASDMAVIVNPSTPVSDLSLAEVRKVFRGDRQYWTKDVPVVLLIRAPQSRERSVILKTLYGMSESQFKQYWIAKIFRAEATTAPKIVYSNDMATELISVIPGAIAFIPQTDVKDGLKVVKIDGHLPGEPGYPLK
jgi:ABC-type phosphate transport system substrate-binding protein